MKYVDYYNFKATAVHYAADGVKIWVWDKI